MSAQKNTLNNIKQQRSINLVLVYFFILGIGVYQLYIPIFAACFVLFIQKIAKDAINKRANKYKIIIIMTSIAFITCVFILGENLTHDNPINLFILIMFHIISILLLMQDRKTDESIKILTSFTLGLFSGQIIITLYSFFIDPITYGYGLLLSPFNGKELNSADVANILGLCTIVFIYFIGSQINNKDKMLFILAILLSLFAGIFLGGRSYFFIIGLTLIVYGCNKLWRRTVLNKINVTAGLLSLSIAATMLYESNDYFKDSLELVLYRFNLIEEMSGIRANPHYETGIQSGRLDLYIHGLSLITSHPFGGFTPTEIMDTNWYHNIVLDVARTSGWIPLFFLIPQFIILLPLALKSHHKDSLLIVWLPTATLLIMMQSIPIEGDYRIYILYIMGLFILAQKEKTKYYLISQINPQKSNNEANNNNS